ncbi:flavodoxin domain-containing protein [Vallitalea okinawensis]|uniref:flavodoxin domain-containing protein n=1 Tax=Vallitalea okinawensis TaxID=2078660 RepID=UPI001FA863B8|nr:flavodoxin domain-containing protein [Vallitalea okinawensis]
MKKMKTIVIYKSKTGFTKRYAEWIGEELNCDISNYEDFSQSSIVEYDCIIYGSRIHAGKVDGLKKIKTLVQGNGRSKLIIFATGATPLAAEDVINTIWRESFSEEELKAIPHFYMQGGLNYEKMGIGDRLIMKTLAQMLSRKKAKSSVEAGCEQSIGNSYDISSRKYILPLVQFVQKQVKM